VAAGRSGGAKGDAWTRLTHACIYTSQSPPQRDKEGVSVSEGGELKMPMHPGLEPIAHPGFSIPLGQFRLNQALHLRRRERLALHPPRGQATAAAPRFAIFAIVVRLHPATAWISE
jgi:hypothetical protein